MPCNCTDDDYECDYGYHFDTNEVCQPIDIKYKIDESIPVNCYHWY